MRIYHYHHATGEYAAEGFADPDPMRQGAWLLPAFSTEVTPPAAASGKARVFLDGVWNQVPDHRGEVWYRGREPVEITSLGDPAAEGLAPEPDPLSAAETRAIQVAGIVAERHRRLAAGFDFDFGDARGVHRIGTTEADMRGWDEVSALASALRARGLADTPIAIVTDTGATQVTADEWAGVLLAAAAFRQPVWAASFALQAMTPIPADYTADHWWAAG